MRTDKQFVLEEQMDDISCENACVESICAVLCEMGYHVGVGINCFLKNVSVQKSAICIRKRLSYTRGISFNYRWILDRVDRRFHTDYQNNPELLSRLSVHIMKMIKRIQQGYFETNPVLEDI